MDLARLLDTAERPRAENWSLRAALTRYGQPEPQRASAVIELVRRIEAALRPHLKALERDGVDDGDPFVVGVLAALAELDGLGDVLAEWAVDRATARPDARVDEVVADVTARLDALGVAREERPAGPAAARRAGRGRGT